MSNYNPPKGFEICDEGEMPAKQTKHERIHAELLAFKESGVPCIVKRYETEEECRADIQRYNSVVHAHSSRYWGGKEGARYDLNGVYISKRGLAMYVVNGGEE